MVVKNGKYRFVGFVDFGEGYDLMLRLLGK